ASYVCQADASALEVVADAVVLDADADLVVVLDGEHLDVRFGARSRVLHDFANGKRVDALQGINAGAHSTSLLSFQWDQPWFSVNGKGSASDLDIYFVDGRRADPVRQERTALPIPVDPHQAGLHRTGRRQHDVL